MAINDLLEQINNGKVSRRTVLKAGAIAGIGLAGASFAGCIDGGKTKDVVKAGYLPSDHDAPFFIATTKGYFDKYGVKVEAIRFDSGPNLMTQMAAGNIDIGIAGVPPVILFVDKDPSAKIVSAVQNVGSGLFVKKGSGIQTITNLKGKSIGIPGPGSIQDILLRKLLAENNLDYNTDVNVKTVPAGQMIGTMTSGGIDAAMAWEPFVTMAELQGVADVLLRSEQMLPGHPCDSCVASTNMIANYPDSVKGFLKAIRDGIDFIKTNPDEAAAIVASKEWLNIDVEIEKASLRNIGFIFVPDEAYLSGTEYFARELKNMGKTTKDHDRKDLFDLTLLNEL
jgi:NitT/TauT family transport system substrate-binding protein